MLQRTRAMQRNVRMVLILVDSHSSVADLCLKTGNPLLTENALIELEEGGVIEPRGDAPSIGAENAKVAQEHRVAATSQRRDLSVPPASASQALAEAFVAKAAIAVNGVAKTSSLGDDLETPLALAQSGQAPSPATESGSAGGEQSSRAKGGGASFGERVRAYFSRERFGAGKARPVFVNSPDWPPSSRDWCDARAGYRSNAESLVSVPGAGSPTDEFFFRQPTRRGHSWSVAWLMFIVLATVGALCVLVVVQPFNSYLPEFEAAISAASGRSAKVGGLRLSVYPQPSIVLGDVRIGEDGDEIYIDEIRLQPSIGTLMAEKTIFREVMVSGVSLPVEVIAGLPAIFVALSNPSARFGIDHLGFEKAAIKYLALNFSNLDGAARLSTDGLLQSLSLSSADRRLHLVATPRAQGLDVVLEGSGWRPVSGSAFLFDSVNLNAFIDKDGLTIKDMALRIFDGVIEGKAVLHANQILHVVGELSFKRINIARLGDAIGYGQQFSGEASGKMRFSTKGEAWKSLFSAVNAEGDFAVLRGSIRGIDLVEAARSSTITPIQGGGTSFENLSGAIKLTPAGYKFSELVLNSGLMQSTGFLNVSSELVVNGVMELRIRGTANQTRVPISIRGPLNSPSVEAGRGGSL